MNSGITRDLLALIRRQFRSHGLHQRLIRTCSVSIRTPSGHRVLAAQSTVSLFFCSVSFMSTQILCQHRNGTHTKTTAFLVQVPLAVLQPVRGRRTLRKAARKILPTSGRETAAECVLFSGGYGREDRVVSGVPCAELLKLDGGACSPDVVAFALGARSVALTAGGNCAGNWHLCTC